VTLPDGVTSKSKHQKAENCNSIVPYGAMSAKKLFCSMSSTSLFFEKVRKHTTRIIISENDGITKTIFCFGALFLIFRHVSW